MTILNIAGYKFIHLDALSSLREELLQHLKHKDIRGTILVSPEGININLAGIIADVENFLQILQHNNLFAGMSFHRTFSQSIPFKRLKIKIKKEIIAFRNETINPLHGRAQNISPTEFKNWLDQHRDITVLDARNKYEIGFGTFNNAVHFDIDHFVEFPEALNQLDRTKPIVTFCTGGIRCEKAALFLQSQDFQDVYQLEGGILKYFAAVGSSHYEGSCYVFDERVAVDAQLQPIES